MSIVIYANLTKGNHMELPMTNISRNFPGVSMDQYYSLQDLVNGDCGGSTETDSETDPSGSDNYSTINKKSGKVR